MQHFIAVRVLQSLLAALVMSVIVFGLARVSAVVQDILDDRDRSYARLGLDPPHFRTQKSGE